MNTVVAHGIWNYIGQLGVDRETARDLYQEAEVAIWDAEAHRATSDNHSYLVKTGIGAIRHWLRDRYGLIRIPGYLHDRGEAASHMKTIVPLDDMNETAGEQFENEVLDRMDMTVLRGQILHLLPHLTRAERQVMDDLLSGKNIREIARERRVRVGCVYAQRSKAILKLKKLLAGGTVVSVQHSRAMTRLAPVRPVAKPKTKAVLTDIQQAAYELAMQSGGSQSRAVLVSLSEFQQKIASLNGDTLDANKCLASLVSHFPDFISDLGGGMFQVRLQKTSSKLAVSARPF